VTAQKEVAKQRDSVKSELIEERKKLLIKLRGTHIKAARWSIAEQEVNAISTKIVEKLHSTRDLLTACEERFRARCDTTSGSTA
jgi:hypothetical protein